MDVLFNPTRGFVVVVHRTCIIPVFDHFVFQCPRSDIQRLTTISFRFSLLFSNHVLPYARVTFLALMLRSESLFLAVRACTPGGLTLAFRTCVTDPMVSSIIN